ncbi:HMGB4 [Symbiodinium sp. CCMP2456]|nr:HMGB4 [Symbiodinium sp. CCMP2456]
MAPRPWLTSLLVAVLFSLTTRSGLRFTPGLTSPSRSVSATAAEAARKKKVDVNLDTPPKRPLTSYMRYAAEIRPEVAKQLKDAKATEIVSEVANRWRKLTAAKKKPYVTAAEADFAEYRELVQAYVEAGGVMPTPKRRTTKNGKVKLPKDPLRPKKPGSAYILWVKDNYAAIKKKNPKLAPKEVMAQAGKEWSKVTKVTKTKYEKQRAELMKEYEKTMQVYAKEGS